MFNYLHEIHLLIYDLGKTMANLIGGLLVNLNIEMLLNLDYLFMYKATQAVNLV